MPKIPTNLEPSGDAMEDRPGAPLLRDSVSVEIYDQIYTLRGTDAKHIEQIARLVDSKMRAVSAHGGTVDSLRVAVLAALNIADELLALRVRAEHFSPGLHLAAATMRERASSLSEMLDEVLEECKAS